MTEQRFLLPDVGEGLTEADIVSWKVAPGDTIAVNDVIVEIETAKSLVELPSPFAGVVGELLVADRSVQAEDRSGVVAVIDGEFTVKQLCRLPEGVLLRAGSHAHSDILVSEEQSLVVWGVVRWSIHKVDTCLARSR